MSVPHLWTEESLAASVGTWSSHTALITITTRVDSYCSSLLLVIVAVTITTILGTATDTIIMLFIMAGKYTSKQRAYQIKDKLE